MTKKTKEQSAKYVTITQIASSIGRGEAQRRTLIGLGLRKIGNSRRLIESESVLGMIEKVKHLIKIESL